jgi:hypothetical protein
MERYRATLMVMAEMGVRMSGWAYEILRRSEAARSIDISSAHNAHVSPLQLGTGRVRLS